RRIDPEVAALHFAEVARKVRDDCNRKMLDCTRGGTRDRRRHGGGAVCRNDDARRPRSLCAADHRAEIARVGDLVEAGEERALRRGELPAVGVLVGLAPGEYALVVTSSRGFAQLAL